MCQRAPFGGCGCCRIGEPCSSLPSGVSGHPDMSWGTTNRVLPFPHTERRIHASLRQIFLGCVLQSTCGSQQWYLAASIRGMKSLMPWCRFLVWRTLCAIAQCVDHFRDATTGPDIRNCFLALLGFRFSALCSLCGSPPHPVHSRYCSEEVGSVEYAIGGVWHPFPKRLCRGIGLLWWLSALWVLTCLSFRRRT